MTHAPSSNIMRTTLGLEKPVLEELKAFGRREGRSLPAHLAESLPTFL